MTMSMYDTCSFEHGDDQQLILQCVSDLLEGATAENTDDGTFSDALIKWMLLFAGALVFFMQAGFAMLCAGSGTNKDKNNGSVSIYVKANTFRLFFDSAQEECQQYHAQKFA